MKKFVFIALCILSGQLYATNIGGLIATNTTLTISNSPYHVISDLQVPAGISLTIDPGVILFMGEDVCIKVGGSFRIEGTATDRVELIPDSGVSNWGGIFFYDSSNDFDTLTQTGNLLEYAYITGSNGIAGNDIYGYTDQYTIKTLLSTVAIRNCELENNNGYGCLFTQGGYFQHNEIHGNSFYIDHDYYDANMFYFDHNYIHDLSLISFPSPLFTVGLSEVNNNIFENCAHAVILRVSTYAQIINNKFINNSNSWAIALLGGQSQQISGNEFHNNKIHIIQLCERHPAVFDNCFGTAVEYAIQLTGDYDHLYPYTSYDCFPFDSIVTIDYGNNFFTDTSSTVMNNIIYDYWDDVGDLFICNVAPYLTCENDFSVNPLPSQVELNIYPNPTQGELNISIPSVQNKPIKMEVYNSLGEKVWNQVISESNSFISLHELPSGMYFLQFLLDQNVMGTQKLIITR